MLLSYKQLCKLVKQGVINAPLENINGTSIDIRLGNNILIESKKLRTVILSQGDSVDFHSIDITHSGYALRPGESILACSMEVFNLPPDISAEYKLKSTMGRNFLEHLNAGWCDATWCNSVLTLELSNLSKYHTLLLTPGMKIGHVVFFKHDPVPVWVSYAAKGQYNNDHTVMCGKGLK